MRSLKVHLTALMWLCVSTSLQAGTLTVTTDQDEENCRNEAGCTTLPNSGGTNFPNSTGCSLREALDDIEDASNGVTPQRFPECGTADPGPPPVTPLTYTNTIVLAAHMINVNSQVPDPGIDLATSPPCASDVPVACPIQYGELTHVGDATTAGNLEITGGTLTCTSSNILHVNPAGDLTLAGTQFQNCTSPGAGVAITDQNDGNLALNGVTFFNIHSTLDSSGGCIQHGSGNLLITGGSFTGCIADDGTTVLPYPFGGGTNGVGGAISIGNVGSAQRVLISGVTFQGNAASLKGGAIYMSGTDAVAINTSTFQANLAFGDSSSIPQTGGGAIYAENTATGPIPSPPPAGLNASDFLLFQTNFVANLAVKGNGGAILLYNGNLTYGSGALSLGVPGASLAGQIPGGIIASNFSGNQAQGAASASDTRSGSGGAIYAESAQLGILDSSFVSVLGANSSSNASGGAVAYMDTDDSHPPLAISNTTFNGNTAAVNGGAIANLFYTPTGKGGKITLINDTLSGNTTTAALGGGNLFNGNPTATDVNLSNTILDRGGASGNCAGTLPTSVVGNLQYNTPPDTSCGLAAAMTVADPMLKSPAIASGPNILIFTMDLNAGSAASGTGDPGTCANSPIDNLDGAVNGRPSPAGTNCDIGAFESGIVPDMTVLSTHTDPFHQSDVGDTYTITVTNSGTTSTNGTVTVTDTLPAGLTATAIGGTNWACTQPGGPCSRSDVLTSGSSYPEPITLTVNVSASATSGINMATVAGGGEVDTSNDTSNDPTTVDAALVVSPPVITKSFGAASIPLSGSTSLTFKIQNNNAAQSLSSVGFTDALPAGLTISTPNGLSGSCGGGTITATQNTSMVSLSGATLAMSSSCTFSVNVTGTAAGQQNNVTSAVSSTEGGTGNTASANIAVVAPPAIAKAFNPTSVPLNGTSTLTFTLTNPAANTVVESGVAFTDTFPAGLVVATPSGLSNTCNGTATAVAGSASISLTGGSIGVGASCTIAVAVTGTVVGQHTNTSGAVTSTNGGTGNTATADLTVASAPAITKAFGAPTVPLNGTTSLSFTIVNPNAAVALTGLAFTDSLPAGLVVATPSGLTNTCAGTATALAGASSVSLSGGTLAANTSCKVMVNVQGTTAGVKNNSVQVTSTNGGTGNTSNASLTVMSTTPVTLQSFDVE